MMANRTTIGATRYDLIVVDTAPTGHALRLMEMPDVAREWVQLCCACCSNTGRS